MDNKKENRSMYLYTALIFVVALLLILLAFFSQTNISKLGKRAEEFTTPAPVFTTASPQPDELAKVSNMAAELDAENKALQTQIAVYDNLLSANAHIANGNLTDAETIFLTIDEASLTDNQRILYEEIKTKINEGKEQ